MAIPKITKQNILDALNFIDDKGVPSQNESTKYELVIDDKRYPPKYVIAVANHLATGNEISTESFNAVDAKNYLKTQGFVIETIETNDFKLSITREKCKSTDKRFSMDNLGLGDNYEIQNVYFKHAKGKSIKRKRDKGEQSISNKTMPRLVFQIFEKQFSEMSEEDKKSFPVYRPNANSEIIRGIYSSEEEFKKYRNSNESVTYTYDNNKKFVIYCWNIFSTVLFCQESLKRFGQPGDKFVLTYREKDKKNPEINDTDNTGNEELAVPPIGYKNKYSSLLIESKNIIFRGAPGTGKSYLAREIAADIISNGACNKYEQLSDEQKKQVEFVQFHPSYDYTNFVEGLRPKINDDGTMGFELQDGIFKKFVARARKNYENSKKTIAVLNNEMSVQESMDNFFSSIEFGHDFFKTISTKNKFTITSVDDKHINVYIPNNACVKKLSLNLNEVRMMLESGKQFNKITDITNFFGKTHPNQEYSYDFVIYKEIKKHKSNRTKINTKVEELKKYVFIIDEINRGEISKILGELFFSIDPSYRGKAGEISTQYSNMYLNQEEKFYIPENVYIIGTMNDIDRSVDTFDFAMRRRFRFVKLDPNDRLEMLESLGDESLKKEAIRRMKALNNAIMGVEDLKENYQIGAAYFLKLKTMNFDELWKDCLEPLLNEYVQGMYDSKTIMTRFEKAYNCASQADDNTDEISEN